MSALAIVAIAAGATVAYVVIGGLTFAIANRIDADPVFPNEVAAAFWPLAAPVAILVVSFTAVARFGVWLGTKRPPRSTLPKAQVRR